MKKGRGPSDQNEILFEEFKQAREAFIPLWERDRLVYYPTASIGVPFTLRGFTFVLWWPWDPRDDDMFWDDDDDDEPDFDVVWRRNLPNQTIPDASDFGPISESKVGRGEMSNETIIVYWIPSLDRDLCVQIALIRREGVIEFSPGFYTPHEPIRVSLQIEGNSYREGRDNGQFYAYPSAGRSSEKDLEQSWIFLFRWRRFDDENIEVFRSSGEAFDVKYFRCQRQFQCFFQVPFQEETSITIEQGFIIDDQRVTSIGNGTYGLRISRPGGNSLLFFAKAEHYKAVFPNPPENPYCVTRSNALIVPTFATPTRIIPAQWYINIHLAFEMILWVLRGPDRRRYEPTAPFAMDVVAPYKELKQWACDFAEKLDNMPQDVPFLQVSEFKSRVTYTVPIRLKTLSSQEVVAQWMDRHNVTYCPVDKFIEFANDVLNDRALEMAVRIIHRFNKHPFLGNSIER